MGGKEQPGGASMIREVLAYNAITVSYQVFCAYVGASAWFDGTAAAVGGTANDRMYAHSALASAESESTPTGVVAWAKAVVPPLVEALLRPTEAPKPELIPRIVHCLALAAGVAVSMLRLSSAIGGDGGDVISGSASPQAHAGAPKTSSAAAAAAAAVAVAAAPSASSSAGDGAGASGAGGAAKPLTSHPTLVWLNVLIALTD